MSDMDFLSASSYAVGGKDPIGVAETWITVLLDAHENLVNNREPAGLPRLPAWPDLSHAALARKVIGRLLDAGWRPPSDAEIAEAVQQHRDYSVRYDAWWATFSPERQAELIAFYSEHGGFPPDVEPPSRRDALGEHLRGAS